MAKQVAKHALYFSSEVLEKSSWHAFHASSLLLSITMIIKFTASAAKFKVSTAVNMKFTLVIKNTKFIYIMEIITQKKNNYIKHAASSPPQLNASKISAAITCSNIPGN